ncbi:Zinc finger C2H2 LYAR-type domain-containing protein [[Candida] zeylanoides]
MGVCHGKMVSFSCEVCNDTVVKKKLEQHQQRCRGAYFSCIDCSVTFHNNDHRQHTSCISEAEKYEKALYKGKKQPKAQQKAQPKAQPVREAKSAEAAKESKSATSAEAAKEPKKATSAEAAKEPKSATSAKTKSPASFPSALAHLRPGQTQTLYKVVKKADKADRKSLLKRLALVLGDDGTVEVKLI